MDAVKSGRWSDPGTWGGEIPGQGDVACTAGHLVTIDQDAAVRRLATAGGYFVTEGTVSITVTEPAVSAGEPGSYVLGVGDGDVVAFHGPVTGGGDSLRHGILHAGGQLTVHGDLTGGDAGNAFAVWQLGGTLTVQGTLEAGAAEAIRSDGGVLRLDATWKLGPVPAFTGTTPILVPGDYLAVIGAGEDGEPLLLAAGRKLPARAQTWPPRHVPRRTTQIA